MGPFVTRTTLLLCACRFLAACDTVDDTNLPATAVPVELPCDVQKGCRAENDFLAVTVVFGSEARALQPFPLQMRFERQHEVDSVSVAFSMEGMDMGWNRYQLKGDSMSGWNASVTLPICVSGRTDWLADFELLVDNRRFQLQIPFVLDK